ncbi:MAG: DeoR/GlpR family DNA-binding transcription regulator [Eubacterium sp.]|nr:DeoR/GlpR family DNA-binding transcription regulator [Eubacterium sp.]
MLTEKRFEVILDILRKQGAVKVQTLTEVLGASESTVRRDLTVLDQRGLLKKVHGGAAPVHRRYSTEENDVKIKAQINSGEKKRIGSLAAGLIEKGDFVYIDAGTTTSALIDFIEETEATYVTNGLGNADKLLKKGCSVYIVGGKLRTTTEAVVGEEAVETLEKYNFTLGFFGTNGINFEAGFTTPDVHEGAVKQKALGQCKKAYVLADSSKFDCITPVHFGDLSQAAIITGRLRDQSYHKYTEILEADKHDLHGNL